jgi:AmiR/NasT family two-component response regulator
MEITDTRDVHLVAQATGVIMGLWGLDSDNAWTALRYGADNFRMPIEELARLLVDCRTRAELVADLT